MPKPEVEPVPCGLGDASIGITAGSGREGAGDTERREREENEDRRLWLTALVGFMGTGNEVGVPGADGTGDPTEAPESTTDNWAR